MIFFPPGGFFHFDQIIEAGDVDFDVADLVCYFVRPYLIGRGANDDKVDVIFGIGF